MKQGFNTIFAMIILGLLSIFITLYVADRIFNNQDVKKDAVANQSNNESRQALKNVTSELALAKNQIGDLKAKVEQLTSNQTTDLPLTINSAASKDDHSDEGVVTSNISVTAPPSAIHVDPIEPLSNETKIIAVVARSEIYRGNQVFNKYEHIAISRKLNELYDIEGLSRANNRKLETEIFKLNDLFIDHVEKHLGDFDQKSFMEITFDAKKLRRLSDGQNERIVDLFQKFGE